MMVGAVYQAHWPDGSCLQYMPLPWINGGGVDWRWITEPKEDAAA